ncbi:MAG: PsbP-related protein [Eubacteriales bacterium]|nr:PsbP-related protein [Eubacteriales bacterium]MDD4421930.1 PsbP-related protein [Eubacteriales bacterium]HBR30535.1 hypothetical protein [Clostridiales bacterium]
MKKTLTLLIAIVAFLLVSCKSEPSGESLPDGMLLANNEAVDYYFYYPEGWEIDRNEGMISIRYNTSEKVGLEEYASISVMSFTNKDTAQVVNKYWEENVSSIANLFEGDGDDYAIKDESEIRLDNVVSARKVYTGTLDGNTYKFAQVICIRNSIVYLITFTGTEDDYSNLIDDFDTVISNFHFK